MIMCLHIYIYIHITRLHDALQLADNLGLMGLWILRNNAPFFFTKGQTGREAQLVTRAVFPISRS